jgi:serine/threonine protein kinase/WD40 repeat protein
MSDLTAPPSPEEEALAQFAEDLLKADDRAKVLSEYCRRYPELASRLRDQVALTAALDQAGGQDFPARLGDFRIVGKVERTSGMGLVLEAVQEPLERRVAVKIIRPNKAGPSLKARFRREQKVLAALHQTHIVPIHAAGKDGELDYFAMPFLKGATLQEVIQTLSAEARGQAEGTTPTLAQLAERLSTAASARPIRSASEGASAGPRASVKSAEVSIPAELSSAPRQKRSSEYYQSLARFMAEAGEALQHAHDLHILHRDIKPSNLMVDHSGNCWIIDFGLASFMDGAADLPGPAWQKDEGIVSGADAPGTPPYMAPEQWKKEKLDGRTDVWALGVTLYELLTLQPAFSSSQEEFQKQLEEIRKQVIENDPPSPRTFVSNVPRDLESICRKAMYKNPARRYQTAGEFAEDLKRWMHGEPISGSGVFRRVGLWTGRNKGWALAIACGLLAFLTLAVSGIALAEADVRTAKAETRAAKADALAAQEREQEQTRQVLLQKLQLKRQRAQGNWSAESWDLVRRAATIRSDDDLRNQAAAILIGLNARRSREIREFDASAVLFDQAGKRLLIGGADPRPASADRKAHPTIPARILDLVSGDPILAKEVGPGPIAFLPDGTAVHVVVDQKDRLKLRLRVVQREEIIRDFRIPGEEKTTSLSPSTRPALAMTPDGRLLAASVQLADAKGKGILVVWDVKTGKELRKVAGIDKKLSALALNREAGLVVAGNEQGEINVWSLHKDRPAAEFSLPALGQSAITGLAMQRAVQRRPDKDQEKPHWLLAAADSGGRLTIWDLDRKIPKAFCHGSHNAVHAVAFSPYVASLVSAGRGPAKLLYIATGRFVLTLPSERDFSTGLAFSPDGKKVAFSNRSVFGGGGGVGVCELEYGRGIQSLRGLTGRVSKVLISKGSKYLAALSDGWQVAIWDLQTGFLRHLLDVPPGFATDNASMAFSPDNKRFAFASGKKAQLWDLEKGRLLQSWELPPGLQDALAFDVKGKRLMLCRWESAEGMVGDANLRKGSQVCRVRDLLSLEPMKELARIPLQGATYIMASPDAGYFALVRRDANPIGGKTEIYSGFSAKKLQSISSHPERHRFDPSGKILALGIGAGKGPKFNLMEMPSRKPLDSWEIANLACLSPGARFWGAGTESNYGFRLGRGGDNRPLVTLGIDSNYSSNGQFSDDGRLVAWGTGDGTVLVCNHREVQRHLTEVGLSWE